LVVHRALVFVLSPMRLLVVHRALVFFLSPMRLPSP